MRLCAICRRKRGNAEDGHSRTAFLFMHHFSFLQGNDVRIILGQFNEEMAAKVFCCVSKKKKRVILGSLARRCLSVKLPGLIPFE